MTLGTGAHVYEARRAWPTLPEHWELVETSDVAIDSRDRVWVFDRGAHPVMVFDRDGRFVTAWGEGLFRGPHGITIGPDDSVYLADRWAHVVMKFSPKGELLLTLGDRDKPSPTYAGKPFNMPTGLAVAPSGEMFVSDGYGNRRVHRYSAEGKLLASWGQPGSGPGQFALSHNVAVDRHGRVYVCDRENDRVQIFDAAGTFLGEWTDTLLPQDLWITRDDLAYVAEKGTVREQGGQRDMRVTVRGLDGRIQSEFSGEMKRPHGIAVDSRGDVYVADLTARVHKFARRG